ncbi:protein kinase, putative [Trichophyton benhamiae CBS 112371]|uniref:cyclin-dependent kinase n=1 Tax=Arthroderma benhamiae (strain ATCC MYA-4681 / CBS 112371) TaxID=663331 RepID=D4AR45_ARTBC|nr:protein kinase, putative [Trichophyton benhamiae CBS 112371]EFE34474.1 protein kinase, putative [Trichophyton benhamiae CBS 112371]
MAGYDRHLSMREQRRDGHDEYETIEQKTSKRGAYHQKSRHPLRRKEQDRSDRGRADSYRRRSSLHRTDQGRGGGRRTASPSPHDDSAAQEQRKSCPEQQVRVRQDEEAHSHSQLEEYKRLRSASPPFSRRRHSSVSRRQARGGSDDYARKHGKFREHSNFPKRNHLSDKGNRHANDFIEDFAGTSSRSHPPSDEQSHLTASPRPFAPPFPRNIDPHSRPASRYPLTSRASHYRSPSASSFRPLEPVSSDHSKPGYSPLPIASVCKDSSRQRTNNDEHMRDTYPVHGVRPAEARSSRRPSHPSVDTRQTYTTSPQYVTPTSSRHESPQSASPYSGDNPAIRLKVHHRANIIKVNHPAQGIFHPAIPLRPIEEVARHIVHPPPLPMQIPSEEQMSLDTDEEDNPFRPSKELQVEDQGAAGDLERPEPPPKRQPASTTSQPKESGKFSFAFKTKPTPSQAPKPIPDLTHKMREPPRPLELPKTKPQSVTSKLKHETRSDRRDDRRDPRRAERRFDAWDERRRERRDDRRESRPEKRKDRTTERSKPKKKILTRMKPRPTLSEEFSRADSVYYRKPGNESVVGAGTYGKVFKAVHVFTKNMVALKRIRMEGEKDGFPITAVREIRLLQHLHHQNVVSLQEVMVEKNECFMVFEYLSHDLTGLINHPTFVLSAAHKKHLAKQMFEGLNYLHHRGVLHRDIKAANILISNQGQLKFADFGLARFFSKSRQLDYTNRVITIWYRPPELLLGETRYGPAVDIWSAACVYMEMFTKKAIFPGDGSELNQIDKLYNSLGTPTRADWPDIIDMPWFELMRPAERKKRAFEDLYRDSLSPAALDLVASIFQYDASKRPSAEEILAHPYFVSEEPRPQQAMELADVEGDWHEFESKAHRKEKDKEARRAEQREREKRKIAGSTELSEDRESKRTRLDDSAPTSQGAETEN